MDRRGGGPVSLGRAERRRGRLVGLVPVVSWLPAYDRKWLGVDAIAGLTLWGLLAPEAMAYAGIAGLPPQTGLYTLLASLFVYAIFGTSRHLSVQPTSATAALIASTVVALGVTTTDMATYQSYATMLVLLVGVGFGIAGVARLGFVVLTFFGVLLTDVLEGMMIGLVASLIWSSTARPGLTWPLWAAFPVTRTSSPISPGTPRTSGSPDC
jgi:MFS superfamily sulfate permease-like transporter